MANQYGTKCPKCGSSDFVDSTRLEHCLRCGYAFYYGDAHATGEAQISKELDPGQSLPPVREDE